MVNTKGGHMKDPWTQDEMKLIPGIANLALAVIKQWRNDGYPNDPGIKVWEAIYDAASECERHSTPERCSIGKSE